MEYPQLPAFIQALKKGFSKEQLLLDPAECWAYGYDNSRRQAKPDAVIFPYQAEQIQTAIELCNQFHIPLVARGRATGTPGGAVPVQGGLVLACERMQKIIKMDPVNRIMVVEPGVLNQTVQNIAAEHGFFWAPDPSSAPYCTIGGNLAYNSAGPRAVKYGTTRENTLALRAVTGAGHIIHTGAYTTKSVVGYDLTRLLIGSEGTLAIITEATLKLTPLPEAKQTLRVLYRSIAGATQAITQLMAQPTIPCALEFMDDNALHLIREQGVTLLAEANALLLIEVDGLASELPGAVIKLKEAAAHADLLEIKVARDNTETKQLWEARKALSPALRTIAPGKINEDVVVPVGKIPDLLQGLAELANFYKIKIVNFGHAGNGNIHVNLLINNQDSQQREAAAKCLKDVFKLVLKNQGSLSGEHGIGIEKRDFITYEIDSNSLALMRKIKAIFDPNAILNPGKLFPPEI